MTWTEPMKLCFGCRQMSILFGLVEVGDSEDLGSLLSAALFCAAQVLFYVCSHNQFIAQWETVNSDFSSLSWCSKPLEHTHFILNMDKYKLRKEWMSVSYKEPLIVKLKISKSNSYKRSYKWEKSVLESRIPLLK